MKKLFFAIILSTSFYSVHAQEILCKVNNPSPFFDGYTEDYAYKGILQSGDLVTATNSIRWRYFPSEGNKQFFIYCSKEGEVNRVCVFPQNLAPVTTDELFGPDVLTDTTTFSYYDRFNGWNDFLCREMWVPIHYVDVLRSKDRETLPKYDPYILDYNKDEGYEEHYGSSEWYDIRYFGIDEGMLTFFNPFVYASAATQFLIKTIKKYTYGYIVECFVPRDILDEIIKRPYFNWALCTGETITLILQVDGEYMDIYINEADLQHKFGTIVRVKEEFIRQYQDLIKNGSCDFTNVQWPRRADGSRDYSLPTTSVLEEPKQPETAELSVDTATESLPSAKSSEKSNALPLWAWFAIGVAVVIAGGVVLVIRKK